MTKYLVFLMVLAGCTPVGPPPPGPPPPEPPAWQHWIIAGLLVFWIGYYVGNWLTTRKYQGLFIDYTALVERLTNENVKYKNTFDERVTAMLIEMDVLRQTINRLKNDRRY